MSGPQMSSASVHLTQRKIEVYPTVMILGNGSAAVKAARAISKQQPVVMVDGGSLPSLNGVICYEGYTVKDVKGHVGRYLVSLQGVQGTCRLCVCAIVIALATPKVVDPLLKLPQAQGIMGLSNFQLAKTGDWAKGSVAFVLGDEVQSFTSTALALQYALELKEKYAIKVDVFFKEMKVATSGLEHLYQRARAAGVRFNRYLENLEVHVNVLGVNITYNDPLLPQAEPAKVLVDLLLAGEIDLPAPDTAELSKLLQIDLGPQGFFQADSLQHYPICSNREGLYVVGSCHHPIHTLAESLEVEVVAAKLARFAKGYALVPQNQTQIDASKCALCMTCYHVCPHKAIELDISAETIQIDPLACYGCGTCAAICPAEAIKLPQVASQHVTEVKRDVVILACRNSFISQDYFYKLAPLTFELTPVACACQIDIVQVLEALEARAEGVLILTCLPGNCQHQLGHQWVQKRLKRVRKILTAVGISPLRVQAATVAANDWRRTLQAVAKLVESFQLGFREGEIG